MRDNPPFAEIELDAPRASFSVGRAGAAPDAAQPQAVPARVADPLRTRFRDMRRIEDFSPYAYRNDGWLFYEQARFMADVEDDYPHRAAFSAFYPFYGRMGYEQLRTYFTWRTRLRGGEFSFVGASYLFLYAYELLSCIGIKSPREALEKLEALWPHYREDVPALAQYLTAWARDFRIYYGLEGDFFNEQAEAQNAPAAHRWLKHSGYDIKKSKFYPGNEKLLTDGVAAVFAALTARCEARRARIEEVFLFGDKPKIEFWKPFAQALFHPWHNQPNRRVVLPTHEVYVCHDNRWSVERPRPFAGTRELVGFAVKKTEAQLRTLSNYKQKLKADAATLKYAAKKLQAAGLSLPEMEQIIEQAVAAFHRDLHRIDVKVDAQRLAQIREEAQDTQERLTVEEESPPVTERIDMTSYQMNPPPPATPPADPWDAFFAALSDIERGALAILCKEAEHDSTFRTFAAAQGEMPEVLAEAINEKALEHIGDNILDTEDGFAPYAEYRDKLRSGSILSQ